MIHDAVVHKITRRNPFLQDWPYYSRIDILNPVATAQYQHSVTIPTKSGMAHDFRDLRFFQPDGTEIPFWTESKTDGSTAFVWFKPYSLSQRNVYCFYGNREAVSQSNGDKTFEFFDDFLGTSLDATKWNVKAGSRTISNSTITEDGTSAQSWINSVPQTFGQNTWIEWYGSMNKSSTIYVGYDTADNTKNAFIKSSSVSTYERRFYITPGGGDQATFSNVGDNNNHTWSIKRTTTTVDAYMDRGSSLSQKAYTDATNTGITILANPEGGTSVIATIYWIFVRKYTATEPVCQLNQSGLRNPAYR